MSRSTAGEGLRLVDEVFEVCVDSAEENMVSGMALRASSLLDSHWNGWARPLATAAAMHDFLERWRRNDPNGTWGDVSAVEGLLLYSDDESDEPEAFRQVGSNGAGEPLYDLTGWMWVPIESSKPTTGGPWT